MKNRTREPRPAPPLAMAPVQGANHSGAAPLRSRLCNLRLALLALPCLWAAGAEAPSPAAKAPAAPEPDAAEVEAAIEKALDYVEAAQQPEGCWQNSYRVEREWETQWAVLAFLANGHSPRNGPYRQTVEKGLLWLTRHADLGEFRDVQKRGMNTTRVRTLFTLLQAIGFGTPKVAGQDLVILCEQGLERVLALQHRNQEGRYGVSVDTEFLAGGWGYVEESYWSTLCLLGAQQAGLKVPLVALEEAAAFWKRHYQPQFGTFYDQASWSWRDSSKNCGPALTVRCLIALALLGEGGSKEAKGGLEVVRAQQVAEEPWFWRLGQRGEERGTMGGHSRALGEWYLSLALGGSGENELAQARRDLSRALLALRQENGSFRFPGRGTEKDYLSPKWFAHRLGYGDGWTEATLAAQAAYGLGLPKALLPAFTPWRR